MTTQQGILVARLNEFFSQGDIKFVASYVQSEEKRVRVLVYKTKRGNIALYNGPTSKYVTREVPADNYAKIALVGSDHKETKTTDKLNVFTVSGKSVKIQLNGTVTEYTLEASSEAIRIPVFDLATFYSKFASPEGGISAMVDIAFVELESVEQKPKNTRAKVTKKADDETLADDDVAVSAADEDEIPTVDDVSDTEDVVEDESDIRETIDAKMKNLRKENLRYKKLKEEVEAIYAQLEANKEKIERMEKNVTNCNKYLTKNKTGAERERYEKILKDSTERLSKLRAYEESAPSLLKKIRGQLN